MKTIALFILPLLFFTGCFSSYPMGLSEKQWEALSQKQKLKLTKEQAKLDHELALKREKNRAIERQKELAIELQKQKQLTKLYEKAEVGDIIVVNFEKGLFRYYNDKYLALIPQAVIIARGETKKLTVEAKNEAITKSYTLYLHYNRYGTHLELSFEKFESKNSEKVVLLNSGRWDRGERYKKQLLDDKIKQLSHLNLLIRYHEATIKKNYILLQ